MGHGGPQSMKYGRANKQTTTTGWRPGCEHSGADGILNPYGEASTVPCTVLDPFLGSGTTALVARRLGRRTIGIELNPEYAAMAERRIRTDAGLFAEIEKETA